MWSFKIITSVHGSQIKQKSFVDAISLGIIRCDYLSLLYVFVKKGQDNNEVFGCVSHLLKEMVYGLSSPTPKLSRVELISKAVNNPVHYMSMSQSPYGGLSVSIVF